MVPGSTLMYLAEFRDHTKNLFSGVVLGEWLGLSGPVFREDRLKAFARFGYQFFFLPR